MQNLYVGRAARHIGQLRNKIELCHVFLLYAETISEASPAASVGSLKFLTHKGVIYELPPFFLKLLLYPISQYSSLKTDPPYQGGHSWHRPYKGGGQESS